MFIQKVGEDVYLEGSGIKNVVVIYIIQERECLVIKEIFELGKDFSFRVQEFSGFWGSLSIIWLGVIDKSRGRKLGLVGWELLLLWLFRDRYRVQLEFLWDMYRLIQILKIQIRIQGYIRRYAQMFIFIEIFI